MERYIVFSQMREPRLVQKDLKCVVLTSSARLHRYENGICGSAWDALLTNSIFHNLPYFTERYVRIRDIDQDYTPCQVFDTRISRLLVNQVELDVLFPTWLSNRLKHRFKVISP
jgi:hypothetical protein